MPEVDLTYYEIDGKNYIISKKAEYNGSLYVLFVNEEDYTDSFVQKEVNGDFEPVENGEVLQKVLSIMKDTK